MSGDEAMGRDEALEYARDRLAECVADAARWSGIHDADAEQTATTAREHAMEWGIVCNALGGAPVTNIVLNVGTLPHLGLPVRVFRDGDQWCCLYGENLQEGVAGFGDTPAAACAAFDRAWTGELDGE